MTINKKEFSDRMAENGGITKKSAYEAVGLFIDTLMDYLGEDEKVMFTGFGRFEMRKIKARKGRNPVTGKQCTIPEHQRVKFIASDVLVDRIKERMEDDTYEPAEG